MHRICAVARTDADACAALVLRAGGRVCAVAAAIATVLLVVVEDVLAAAGIIGTILSQAIAYALAASAGTN